MTEKTLTCGGCGETDFKILFNVRGDLRAECAVCGRETRALDTVQSPRARPSSDRRQALEGQPCAYCEEPIDGDVMIPDGEGPMHAECWVEWMGAQ